MPTIDLRPHIDYLTQLDAAIDDALHRYRGNASLDVGQLNVMKTEVARAKQTVEDLVAKRTVPLDSRDQPTGSHAPRA
jgi:hypothetical protein